MSKPKFLIITTVPQSLGFFKGQIQVLKRLFDVQLISSSGSRFDDICLQEEVKGYSVNMKREISLFHDVVSLINLIRLFLKLKPSVVHGSTPKAGLLSMFAAWLIGVPTRIYYVHGLRYQGLGGGKRKLLILMEKMSCYFATHVFAVSFGVKGVMEKEGITKKELSVIGNGSVNGINLNFYSKQHPDILDLREDYNLNSENFVFGFIGRLVKDKGIQELVTSFLRIHKNEPNARLLLVGEFESADSVDDKTKEQILMHPAILNVGFQKDVRSFLAMMDVFVFPSYREGFGVSLMEAAAMGVPAISSDITGCNEIVKNEYNGILIPPKSVEKLDIAMNNVIVQKDLVTHMSSVCRDYVALKYEQKMVWANTLKSYTKIF
jgi:glycosyltransferase involved in cell wall biosynthesis